MPGGHRASDRLKRHVKDNALTTSTLPLTTTNTSSGLEASAQVLPAPTNQKRPRELSIAHGDAAPTTHLKPKSKSRKRQGTRTAAQLAASTAVAVAPEHLLPPSAAPAAATTESLPPPAAALARRVLPGRKRQEHPGHPDLPQARRTSKEVRAHEEEERCRLERLEQLRERQALEIAEEAKRDELQELEDGAAVVLTWEDQLEAAMNAPTPEPDSDNPAMAQTLGREAVYMDSDDEEPVYYRRTMPGLIPPKEDTKGKGSAVSVSQNSHPRAGRNTSKTTGKKVSKATTFAAGLKPGWRTGTQAAASSTSCEDTPAVGGLNNDDAGGARPRSRMVPAATKHGWLPCNEVIQIDSDSNGGEDTGSGDTSQELNEPTLSMALKKQTLGPAKPTASKTKAQKPRSTRAKAMGAQAVKTEPVADALPAIKSEPNTTTLMPAFTINDYWTTSLLPTIHACFASSSDIWNVFKKSPETVITLQKIIDTITPGSPYRVCIGDEIFNKTVDRMYEKRSEIGRLALEYVDTFYTAPSFVNNPAAIREHVAWALHQDGPAFWEEPTPMDQTQTMTREHPWYDKPLGFLQSPLINIIMSLIMRRMVGSRIRYPPPKGAVVLTMIAVERAFDSYRSGTKGNVKTFSQNKYQQVTHDYTRVVNNIKPHRWEPLLQRWGSTIEEQPVAPNTAAAVGSLENSRRFLMPSSSPAPED
ncbi:hypothetical protein CONPUDRAFT_69744 [Coniophora puteana RWD-64-598 SS2]|uniref:Uncharacterized protein n=1 Tax=Coniophora puteana (strain RWD-64-598) TaxID=741705 RepID=A0A5M3N1H1_CONPW|nr:uncharacterized protein CONPUDRAFT_69744 [Coniophora puteana RWD-64-598 SS2]EIW84721.1 hypothetical protein CONPUDRAFT_69744 [Coniophora puteana RWD-64-598 SS2]